MLFVKVCDIERGWIVSCQTEDLVGCDLVYRVFSTPTICERLV